jgi:DnaJ domain
MAAGALSIKLKCASWSQLATIYKRDLTRGAMFLKASAPPPVGTQVRIDLTLPSGSVIVLTGSVDQHVTDAQRGNGVELKLAPIPAGTTWMIESALSAEKKRAQPSTGIPIGHMPTQPSGPIAAFGGDLAEAESELVRALGAEVESLKKLNPFLVLGIGYEASDNDVRAAFGELTKRYHPDRFARYESADLRTVAAEIFILIRDAYRRVCDEASRTQVLTSLGRPATPPPRAIPTPASLRAATPAQGIPRVPPARMPTGAIPIPRIPPVATTPLPIAPQVTTMPTTRIDDVPKGSQPPPPPKRAPTVSPPPIPDTSEHSAVEELLDHGKLTEALAQYRTLSKKHPNDRTLRAGIELCEGLAALGQRDRMEAAQRFEAALEIDPSNERAARELAEMRRQATNERKGLLSRLMGKKE